MKVLDAIEAVAKGTPVDPHLPGGVGTSGAKYEAAELTLGDRGYVDDIRVPGMLHAAFVRASLAHAKIKGIGAAPALALKGVHAVLSAADMPRTMRERRNRQHARTLAY